MQIPDSLNIRLLHIEKVAAAQTNQQIADDLRSLRQVLLNLYALALDMTYDDALGMAESMAMAHPDYEKASDATAMELCLKRFFLVQANCENAAGKQPWMRSYGTWAQIVFKSAMKPIGDSTWQDLKKETQP